MVGERSEEFLDEVAGQPEVSQVEPGEAPGRLERPDFGTVIETGKATARIDRLTAQHDIRDAAEAGRLRGSLLRQVEDRAHATVEAERLETEAAENFPTQVKMKRMAASAKTEEKAAAKAKRNGAWEKILNSFKPGRPN